MPHEIEAKLKVDSHDPVRARLKSLKAAFQDEVIETDSYFDRPDGSLRRNGIALRLRESRPANQNSANKVVLTVKGPAAKSKVKSREEIELEIANAGAATRMLDMLGFRPDLVYEKRRELWKYRECVVSLDHPPYIGLFVEIEGPDENAIDTVQKDLGLERLEHVRSSYAAMLSSYCDQHGITDRKILLAT